MDVMALFAIASVLVTFLGSFKLLRLFLWIVSWKDWLSENMRFWKKLFAVFYPLHVHF